MGLEWVGSEVHVDFWPEPARVSLFGLVVHMLEDHPVYPEMTKLFCRY
jgi:hypothetical protein